MSGVLAAGVIGAALAGGAPPVVTVSGVSEIRFGLLSIDEEDKKSVSKILISHQPGGLQWWQFLCYSPEAPTTPSAILRMYPSHFPRSMRQTRRAFEAGGEWSGRSIMELRFGPHQPGDLVSGSCEVDYGQGVQLVVEFRATMQDSIVVPSPPPHVSDEVRELYVRHQQMWRDWPAPAPLSTRAPEIEEELAKMQRRSQRRKRS
jgi:hypothetical protein